MDRTGPLFGGMNLRRRNQDVDPSSDSDRAIGSNAPERDGQAENPKTAVGKHTFYERKEGGAYETQW